MAWELASKADFLTCQAKEFSSAYLLEDVTVVIVKQNDFVVVIHFYFFEENSLPVFRR